MPDNKDKPKIRLEVVEDEKIEETPNTKTEEPDKIEETKEEMKEDGKVDESTQEEIKEERKFNKKLKTTDKIPVWILFFSFIVGLTLGAGLVGGIFYYRTNVDEVFNTEPSPTPIEQETEETNQPTEEPKEEIKLENYKVSILNGSGIKGEAGKVEALLKDTGFTNTSTGNASSYDFGETEIAVKEDVPNSVVKTIEDTLKDYEMKEIDNLKTTDNHDIVITVGSSKN